MFCPKCGTQIPDDSVFCPACGAGLSAGAPTPAPVAPPQPPTPAPAPPPAPAPAPVFVAPAPAMPTGPYEKGPLGARLLAWIIDGIIAGALLPAGILLIAAASASEDPPVAGLVIAGIGGLWQVAYMLCRDISGGSGFGKRLAGIVVISSVTGGPATGGATVLRQLVFYALNLIPVVGSLIEPVLVLTNAEGKRLGDKAAKTQVVRSADVAARGIALKTGKGLAVGMLVAAVVVSIIGGVVGGVVVSRSIYGATGAPEITAPSPQPETEVPTETPAEVPPTEAPAQSPEMPLEDETRVSAVNAETSVDAVGNLLNYLKNNDVDAARQHATRNFQEEQDWFFAPAGGALIQFEVTDVYQDAALWVVEVDEEWNSGPQKSRYFVIEEDNTARVDSVDHLD